MSLDRKTVASFDSRSRTTVGYQSSLASKSTCEESWKQWVQQPPPGVYKPKLVIEKWKDG